MRLPSLWIGNTSGETRLGSENRVQSAKGSEVIRARIGGVLIPEEEESLLYSRPPADDILLNDGEGRVGP